MDNFPIQGCPGCDTTGGRMACGVHGAPRVIMTPSNDKVIGQLVTEVRLAVLTERERCRKIAAEHPWKCQGICATARE